MIKPAALHHVLHHHHAGHHAHATTFFFFTGLCDKGPNFAFSKDRVCITLGLSAFPYFGFSLLRIQAFGRFGMPARHEMAHSIQSTATWLKEWQSRHDICLELDVVPRFFSLVDDLGQPITHNQRNAVCIRSQFEGLHQIYTKLDLRWMFPKIAVPPYHPFYKVFHYKPSILGVPYSWKHPDVLRFFQFGPCSPL